MKFLHISDLHIHGHSEDNVNVNNMFTFVSKSYPDHKLIITGDITDDGKPEQYMIARELLDFFFGKVFFCPGNHDFGASGLFYSQEKANMFDDMLTRYFNQGGVFTGTSSLPVVNILEEDNIKIMLIALDSNLETNTPFDFSCGEIGKTQLGALDTILSANMDMTKIVFFHHHPFMHSDPFMEMKDAKSLIRTLYGRVDLVLFGHKHEMMQWQGRYKTKYILASDDSPGKNYAKEIVIGASGIKVNLVPLMSLALITNQFSI